MKPFSPTAIYRDIVFGLLAAALLCIPVKTLAAAFQQDSGADGIVAIDVEHFDAHTPQGSHTWETATSPAGFAGDGAVQSLPNSGANITSNYTANSPRLDFQVNFTQTGTHYVWVRGHEQTGFDDSLHVGLDGAAVTTASNITYHLAPSDGQGWLWTNQQLDGSIATINVTSTGLHTINVWMREDGTVVDKLVLTTSSSYTPTGSGPAESPRSDGGNVAPVAGDDSASTPEDTAIVIAVLDNDSDTDGTLDPATVTVVDAPAQGTAVVNTDGTITYTPDTGYVGDDSFTYTVEDDQGAVSNVATVNLRVTAVGAGFQQDSGTDGIVAIDVEHFDAYTPQGSHTWETVTSPAGFAGTGAMQSLPNSGANIISNYTTQSPRLDFQVNFTQTGTHYVWIRGHEQTGVDDSLHVGLDGEAVTTASNITYHLAPSDGQGWLWTNQQLDGSIATINVTSTGLHTINVWMREDGTVVDKLVLTTSSSYTPTGSGPTESPYSSMPDWVTVDDSTAASDWQAISDTAFHQHNRVQNVSAYDHSYHLGTYTYYSPELQSSDYHFSVDATFLGTGLADDIGIMFRYTNNNNYYRLSLNSRYGFTRLEKKVNGVFTPLATNSRGYANGQLLRIAVNVKGPLIQVFLNDDPLFAIEDASLPSGTVALYTQDEARFENIAFQPLGSSPVVVLASPLAHSVTPSDVLESSAVALNVPAGGYIEFVLDGLTSIVDTSAPYTATFTGVAPGDHTIEAILRDASDLELSRDTNTVTGTQGNAYLAVGDSITNGSGDNYAADNMSQDGRIIAAQGYEANLTDILNGSLTPPQIVINEGIGGDETVDALGRVDSILLRQSDTNRVLLLLGTNDALATIPPGTGCSGTACNGTFKGNMQNLINTIRTTGKEVWVARVPPVFGFSTPFSNPSTATVNTNFVQPYNDVITNELTDRQLGPDFYSYLLGAGQNRISLLADTLHPNALGYVVIAALWHNELNPAAPVPLPFILDNLTPSTTAPFLKQNLLEQGDKYYVDETFVLEEIPAALSDGRWIMTANANKSNSTDDYLSFSVDRAVTVYIAYDGGAASLPAWMGDFVDTGMTVNTSDPDSPMLKLYSKSYNSGTVTLGGNLASGASGADSNYLAVVVEN